MGQGAPRGSLSLHPNARLVAQSNRNLVQDPLGQGASFRSVKQLIEQIDAFISAYNEDAAPFEWTKVNFTAQALASKYANLCN